MKGELFVAVKQSVCCGFMSEDKCVAFQNHLRIELPMCLRWTIPTQQAIKLNHPLFSPFSRSPRQLLRGSRKMDRRKACAHLLSKTISLSTRCVCLLFFTDLKTFSTLSRSNVFKLKELKYTNYSTLTRSPAETGSSMLL